jgi:hypothetical protein
VKVVAFAVAAIAAVVAAAIVIPDLGRPVHVRSVSTPAPTLEPTPEPVIEPTPSASPSPAVAVAAARSTTFSEPEATESSRRLRDRGREPRGSSVTVVEGEHSDGCEGHLEDEEEEEEALEDCEDD